MPNSDPLLTALGQRIRELREAKSLTQERLGEKAELEQAYLSDVERGIRNPSVLVVGRVAGALQISLSELFKGVEA
jgi:transcriptional regulator with XRE-family HTH domain